MVAAPSSCWLTEGRVLAAIGLNSPESHQDDEPTIRHAATTAAAWFEGRCSRRFLAFDLKGDDALTVDGSGDTDLYLPNGPVISLDSVEVDGFRPLRPVRLGRSLATRDASDVYWRPSRNYVRLGADRWPRGVDNVRLELRNGYELGELPEDLVGAAAWLAAWLYLSRNIIAVASMTSNGETKQLDKKLPEIVLSVVDTYRDRTRAFA